MLTVGMMLSRSGRSSLGGSLRALLLMEEMKEQPVSPSNVDSMKAERNPLLTAVTWKDFCHNGNIRGFLVMNQSNIYSKRDRSQGGQIYSMMASKLSIRGHHKDTTTEREGKVAVLMTMFDCTSRGDWGFRLWDWDKQGYRLWCGDIEEKNETRCGGQNHWHYKMRSLWYCWKSICIP